MQNLHRRRGAFDSPIGSHANNTENKQSNIEDNKPHQEGFSCLQKLSLFETKRKWLISGSDKTCTQYRILVIDRTSPMELKAWEDEAPITTEIECTVRLTELARQEGEKLEKKYDFFGILGFIHLPKIYMLLITKCKDVGVIGGRYVYTVKDTQLISVAHKSFTKKIVPKGTGLSKYKQLVLSLDLSKDYYFSYFYDLTHSLQHNLMQSPAWTRVTWAKKGMKARSAHQRERSFAQAGDEFLETGTNCYNEMFLWNLNLARVFLRALPNASYWIVPIIHGYFAQSVFAIGRHLITLTLIARRSRHFAGTRYLKRGVNQSGYVANEVETEQIVHKHGAFVHGQGGFSSFVMLRGSIPLFWSQDNPRAPRPDIIVHNFDRDYEKTLAHFSQLFRRYDSPVGVLSLIKKEEKNSPQETKLGTAFTNAYHSVCQKMAQDSKLKDKTLIYMTYDFANARNNQVNIARDLRTIVTDTVQEVGVFYQSETPIGVESPTESWTTQKGVLRVNCIDCLDRTNVAQFCIGKVTLRHQLKALGVTDDVPDDLFPELTEVLQKMYTKHGDRIAQQYAGSGAMHKEAIYMEDEQPVGEDASGGKVKKTAAGKMKNAISAVKRYYSNNITDSDKQNAINLLLGNYLLDIANKKPHIWDMDSASNFQDSDSAYGTKNDIFKLPYQPYLLGAGVWDARPRDVRKRFQQYLQEKYDPSVLSSFDEEFTAKYAKIIVVSLPGSDNISTFTYPVRSSLSPHDADHDDDNSRASTSTVSTASTGKSDPASAAAAAAAAAGSSLLPLPADNQRERDSESFLQPLLYASELSDSGGGPSGGGGAGGGGGSSFVTAATSNTMSSAAASHNTPPLGAMMGDSPEGIVSRGLGGGGGGGGGERENNDEFDLDFQAPPQRKMTSAVQLPSLNTTSPPMPTSSLPPSTPTANNNSNVMGSPVIGLVSSSLINSLNASSAASPYTLTSFRQLAPSLHSNSTHTPGSAGNSPVQTPSTIEERATSPSRKEIKEKEKENARKRKEIAAAAAAAANNKNKQIKVKFKKTPNNNNTPDQLAQAQQQLILLSQQLKVGQGITLTAMSGGQTVVGGGSMNNTTSTPLSASSSVGLPTSSSSSTSSTPTSTSAPSSSSSSTNATGMAAPQTPSNNNNTTAVGSNSMPAPSPVLPHHHHGHRTVSSSGSSGLSISSMMSPNMTVSSLAPPLSPLSSVSLSGRVSIISSSPDSFNNYQRPAAPSAFNFGVAVATSVVADVATGTSITGQGAGNANITTNSASTGSFANASVGSKTSRNSGNNIVTSSSSSGTNIKSAVDMYQQQQQQPTVNNNSNSPNNSVFISNTPLTLLHVNGDPFVTLGDEDLESTDAYSRYVDFERFGGNVFDGADNEKFLANPGGGWPFSSSSTRGSSNHHHHRTNNSRSSDIAGLESNNNNNNNNNYASQIKNLESIMVRLTSEVANLNQKLAAVQTKQLQQQSIPNSNNANSSNSISQPTPPMLNRPLSLSRPPLHTTQSPSPAKSHLLPSSSTTATPVPTVDAAHKSSVSHTQQHSSPPTTTTTVSSSSQTSSSTSSSTTTTATSVRAVVADLDDDEDEDDDDERHHYDDEHHYQISQLLPLNSSSSSSLGTSQIISSASGTTTTLLRSSSTSRRPRALSTEDDDTSGGVGGSASALDTPRHFRILH